MATAAKSGFLALAVSLLVAQAVAAYEHPLDSHSIREAYFLGRRHDDKTAAFMGQYLKRPPLPKSGPHVAEIEIRTPYEQVALRAAQAPGSYTAQQAEKDYAAQSNLILVRVRINLTPTYPAYVTNSRSKGPPQERPPDFWRDFKIRVLQGKTVTPNKSTGRPLYTTGLSGPYLAAGALEGAEVQLEFDTGQIASSPVRIEVLTPDGQTVEAEFDLRDLK
ncbi:MAG: hypothetical protein WAR21_14085 [Candidatus Acidiferrales bacterium]